METLCWSFVYPASKIQFRTDVCNKMIYKKKDEQMFELQNCEIPFTKNKKN